jgi:hypothetical protein
VLETGRLIVIVRVVQLAGCMTNTGQVFQRVSGETVPVRDPAVLANLFERGKAQEAQAERATATAVERVLHAEVDLELDLDLGQSSWFLLALCAVEYPDDLAERLFSAEGEHVVTGLLPFQARYGDGQPIREINPRVRQHELWADARVFEGMGRAWVLLAQDDGAVAVTCIYLPGGGIALEWPTLRDEILTPAENTASDIVSHLGGSGRAHLRFAQAGEEARVYWADHDSASPRKNTRVEDWVTVHRPGEERGALPARLGRELLRSAGLATWRGPDLST